MEKNNMENQSIEVSQNSQEQEELLTYKQAAKVLGIQSVLFILGSTTEKFST